MPLCFAAVSGLRVNLAKPKSALVQDVEDVGLFPHILSCRMVSLPMKYLGPPLAEKEIG